MLKYLREDIKDFVPYEVVERNVQIKLDANEGFQRQDGLNRYPLDRADSLRLELAKGLARKPEEILMGNGSSELIELVLKAYLGAGETVVSISPTFSMYKQYTIIHKGIYREYPLNDMTRLDVTGFIDFITEMRPKIVILCNPNNPTGTLLPQQDILQIIRTVDAMVILDQAYIEFTGNPGEYDPRELENLIILRTFSKALGLAGIRLGYMIAHTETIHCIHRIRSPYNLNTLTQRVGLQVLREGSNTTIELIKAERERMTKALQSLGITPLPSQANFLFFPAEKQLAEILIKRGILIRSFSGRLTGYFRLTIGTPEENNAVLKAIKEAQHENGKN